MNKTLTLLLLAAITFYCSSCQKEKTIQKDLQLTDFAIAPAGTLAQINVTATYPGKLTATLTVSPNEDMSNAITFTLEKTITDDGPYDFVFTATGLQKSTDYWCQVEVGNDYLSRQTEMQKFSTHSKDVLVKTDNVTSIGFSTAISGGEATIYDNSTITAHGVCWSTSPNPNTYGSHTLLNSNENCFQCILSDLSANTSYYVCAYVIASNEIIYGNELTFTTIEPIAQSFTISGTTFKMLPVSGGTFEMGATAEQGGDAWDIETPVHYVTLNDFFMGETEVTKALWKAVMGTNPGNTSGDNLPVGSVSWYDCNEFVNQLNDKLSAQLNGKEFSLPTEAQWEYAARGGQESQGYKYSGSNNIDDVAWYDANSDNQTHPVAQKQANELGLYDMSGNVSEWCFDWFGNYSSGNTQINPTGPNYGTVRVSRDGAYCDDARFCRVSSRNRTYPDYSLSYVGLRLVLQ